MTSAMDSGAEMGHATAAASHDDVETQKRVRPFPRITIQAFCEEQGTADVLQQAAADRRLAKAHVTVQMGGIPAAVAFYQNAASPNLIIVESVYDREPLLQDVDRLAEVCDAGTKVVVIGHVNDVILYRQLIARGVSDYLVGPVKPIQVMEAISDIYVNPEADPVGQVIAFVGAKGGSGSSTVCHNTAWAMSQALRTDVVIADFDLPFGTAALDFNQDPMQGIAEALSDPDRLDAVLLDRLLSKCSDRLSLFAAPGTLEWEYDLEPRACNTVVDTVRQNLPYVAVDVPHLWTSWAKDVILQADEVVITATPDLASLRNTKNLIELIRPARSNDGPPHLVINQVGVPKRPEIPVADFAQAVGINPTAVIEFEPQLFGTAANNGQMIEEINDKARQAEIFRELAFVLTNRVEPKQETRSLFAPILSKLNMKKTG